MQDVKFMTLLVYIQDKISINTIRFLNGPILANCNILKGREFQQFSNLSQSSTDLSLIAFLTPCQNLICTLVFIFWLKILFTNGYHSFTFDDSSKKALIKLWSIILSCTRSWAHETRCRIYSGMYDITPV